jgi:hypothetical protein
MGTTTMTESACDFAALVDGLVIAGYDAAAGL